MENLLTDNKKIENIVGSFIKNILELDILKKTLDEKLKSIDILINNLIDFCIKKKIFYFVENKISYSSIVYTFKFHLIEYIKQLIDPSNTIINKYIISKSSEKNPIDKNNWDNVSDINSIMLKNFKQLNETFEKNVSFNDNCSNMLPSSKISINFIKNNIGNDMYDMSNDESNEIDVEKISIYIKILINQNKYVIEFTDKLINMCKVISDPDIKYKKNKPYG
jgi:hypothetical protein